MFRQRAIIEMAIIFTNVMWVEKTNISKSLSSRISGVTPADISVLLVYLEQLKYSNPDLFFKLNPDEQKEKQE